MPFYVGDYLAETQLLNTEQHGALVLLMIAYWRNGPIPADDATLRTVTHLGAGAWRKHKPVILSYFSVDDGVLHHDGLEGLRSATIAKMALLSARGKAAARKR